MHRRLRGPQQGMQMLRQQEGGARNGLQPTSERLEAPHEPMPAHLSTKAGGQQHGGEGIKQPCSCSPALLTGLGLWPFWLLGTGAFLVDRSVEPAPTAKQTQ